MGTHFNPKNQTFFIAGPDGVTNISISMTTLDAQRVLLANICISWGVQLGLSLMTLLIFLLDVPFYKYKRAINIIHLASLSVAVTRLTLLVMYFPGPLAEYYVSWKRDNKALTRAHYNMNTTANSFEAIQLALIETALIVQSWGLMKTWSDMWQCVVKALSVLLAIAAVVIKSIWIAHHSWYLMNHTLPVPLDTIGEAATIIGAISIFYFCSIFFWNLAVHMFATRGVLNRPGRGLTSLEILAVGNGVLMIVPSIFAGVDVASGLRGSRVLPFEAGSWVQTLVVIGMPLIGLVARHRGTPSASSIRRPSMFADMLIRVLKTEETTLASPVAESFVVTAFSTNSRRSHIQGEDSSSEVQREQDLELGIRVRRDITVTIEGDRGKNKTVE